MVYILRNFQIQNRKNLVLNELNKYFQERGNILSALGKEFYNIIPVYPKWIKELCDSMGVRALKTYHANGLGTYNISPDKIEKDWQMFLGLLNVIDRTVQVPTDSFTYRM